MKPWKYPDEVAAYIVDHVSGTTNKELVADLNYRFSEKYGLRFTESKIKSYKKNHKLRSGTKGGKPKGYSPVYPTGMCEFVKSIASGKSTKELTVAVNEKYGHGTITEKKMKAYKKNHNINTGLTGQFQKGHVPKNKGQKMPPEMYERLRATMFKKGSVPPNHLQVGEYTHTTDGYLIQKVQENGTQRERFEFVHRAVWEKYNGPVPDGKMVSFLDGNKDNCSIENLTLIDNEINLEMNGKRMRFEDPDLTRVGVKIAEVSVAIRKRGRKVERIRAEQKENCRIQKPEQ